MAGALTGAGLVALLGMAPAYVAVAALYATSVFLTLKAASGARTTHVKVTSTSPWRDLKEGARYVWATPHLRAVMLLAFFLNATAFPLFNGLQPYVAKEVFFTDQRGLGFLVAGGALGALAGALVISRHGGAFRPARMMLTGCMLWYTFMLLYACMPSFEAAWLVLFLAGCAHSTSQVPMTAVLLRNMDEHFRGRVMGIRMLMIYGNMIGLLSFGPLIGAIGYPLTATLYCAFGIAMTALIALRWRQYLWGIDALANKR